MLWEGHIDGFSGIIIYYIKERIIRKAILLYPMIKLYHFEFKMSSLFT